MATPDLGQIMLGTMPDLQKQQAYRQWLDARRNEILAQLMNGNQFAVPEANLEFPAAPAKVVVPDWPSQFAEQESVQAPQAAVMAGGTPAAPLVLDALMNPSAPAAPTGRSALDSRWVPITIRGNPASSDPMERRFGKKATIRGPEKLPTQPQAEVDAPEVRPATEPKPATPAAMSPSFTISPDMYPFLLAAGAELMQPMPMWQTSAGHFGRAMQAGFGATQAQRQGEMDLRAKQAQIDQNMAATEQTRETTKNIPQEGRRISAQADLLLKELENYDELFKLKKEDLGVKIEQARKEGILTEARAKALKEDLQLRPDYQKAVINELNARAQYYRNGGSRSGGGSGETAIEKNVKARAEVLRMKGIDSITALETAWQEVGMGARGDVVVNRKAQNLANLWRKQHERLVKEKKFDGTLEDYALEMAGEATLNATGDGSSVATAALEMLQNERNLAQQKVAPPGSANEPENKVRAKPVPTKRGADGRLVFDPSKMVPGEAYVFPDGEVRTWSGK